MTGVGAPPSAERKPFRVGPGDRQAAPGVPEHPRGEIHPDGGPPQLADLRGVYTSAAADLQAGAAARSEQLAQGATDAQGIVD